MIIIEEDEDDRRSGPIMEEDDFEEELTTEEKRYRSAVALMDSAECVTRYEQRVKALSDAAVLLDKMKGYQDSARLAAKCREMAQKAETDGREEAYQQAVTLCAQAQTPMDFRTAIAELKRFPEYKDAQAQIEACKAEIDRLEGRRAQRNRMIAGVAAVVIAACIFVAVR